MAQIRLVMLLASVAILAAVAFGATFWHLGPAAGPTRWIAGALALYVAATSIPTPKESQ